jgi:hypothetical protein
MTFLAIRWFRNSILSYQDKNIIKMIARIIWNDCENYLPMYQYYLPLNFYNQDLLESDNSQLKDPNQIDPYIGFNFGHIYDLYEYKQDLSGELKLNICTPFSQESQVLSQLSVSDGVLSQLSVTEGPPLHIINLYKKHFPHLDAKTFASIYELCPLYDSYITVVCGFYVDMVTFFDNFSHLHGDIKKTQYGRYEYNSENLLFYGINLSPTWRFEENNNTELLANILCNTYRVPRKWNSEKKFKELAQKDLMSWCGYTKRESEHILKSYKPIIQFLIT